MQLEVLAELQPPVVVRQREAAVDVVGHLFAGGVGEVVQRQDHHVVADADAAILTPEAEEFLRAHLTTSWSSRFWYGRGCPWRSSHRPCRCRRRPCGLFRPSRLSPGRPCGRGEWTDGTSSTSA